MLYVTRVTAPKNTPKKKAVSQDVIIYDECISRIMVRIPPGHQGLAYMAIFYGADQIWPHPKGEWVHGDDQFIVDDFIWTCPEYPTKLTIKAYNEDDTYDHSFIVYISAGSLVDVMWHRRMLSSFAKLLEELQYFYYVTPAFYYRRWW